MSPEGLYTIGSLGLASLAGSGWNVQAVGGLTLGADPVSYAISYASASTPRPLRAFTVRKEAKGHGTGRYLEGPVEPGAKVVIVDDVITTGGSSILAIERAQAFGLEVVHVVAIIDRLQGGAEAFAKLALPFSPLLTIRDFGIDPPAG